MLRDFASYSSRLDWTPIDENIYTITVTALDPATGTTNQASVAYTASSRITGNAPVVSPTAHPLIALYSAPACPAGSSVRVVYSPAGFPATSTQYTPAKACNGSASLNFYLAGMLPWKTYYIYQQTIAGWSLQTGPTFSYKTPGLPASIASQIRPVTVLSSADAHTSGPEQFIVDATGFGRNLAGQVVWYLSPPEGSPSTTTLIRPADGGTYLSNYAAGSDQILREYDVTGNVLHETNVARLQSLLPNFPFISQFHHEVLRLPNGDTAAMVNSEKIYTNIQGKTGPVDLISGGIVVLDRNWQPKWSWSALDHLDLNRAAVLGETCAGSQPGCPTVHLAAVAQDWTHSNSLWYTSDGNLLMSIRHQDWVIKIAYQGGIGNGDIIWRLGKDGDFALSAPSSDAFPWFSHQHDVSLIGNGFLVYDNGNTRQAEFPTAHSRGQFYTINESARTAQQVLSVDLGEFSQAVGSAQRLANGDYFFLSGYLTVNGQNVPGRSTAFEITPSPLPGGTWNYRLQTGGGFLYRSFRLRDFYTYRSSPLY